MAVDFVKPHGPCHCDNADYLAPCPNWDELWVKASSFQEFVSWIPKHLGTICEYPVQGVIYIRTLSEMENDFFEDTTKAGLIVTYNVCYDNKVYGEGDCKHLVNSVWGTVRNRFQADESEQQLWIYEYDAKHDVMYKRSLV